MSEASPPPPARPTRGRRVALVVGALGVCLVVAGVWGWVWLRRMAEPSMAGDPSAVPRLNVLKLCGDVQSYRDEHGTYLVAGPTPAEVPQGHAVPWPEDERFGALGFNPGPWVLFQYEVVVQEDPVGEPEVSCLARGDLDGDGQTSLFRVTLDVNGMTSPVHAEREME